MFFACDTIPQVCFGTYHVVQLVQLRNYFYTYAQFFVYSCCKLQHMPRGHNESDDITWHVVIGSHGLDS